MADVDDKTLPAPVVRSEVVSYLLPALPADLEAYDRKLRKTHNDLDGFQRWMDGRFIDPALGLIPVFGDIACAALTGWVLIKAYEVKASPSDKFAIVGFAAADAAIGFMPVVGDIADFFFRSNTWACARVQAHIGNQLACLDQARERFAALGDVSHDHPDVVRLRDSLLHSGRSEKQRMVRLGAVGAVFVSLLLYWSFESMQRTSRVTSCQQTGGWFCEWRN